MVVKFGNFGYFFFIILAAALIIGLFFFLRERSRKFIYNFLFGITVSALVLHFGKLLFKPYRNNFPYSLKKISFENICAVSTLIFPFIYRSKNDLMKTYMVFMGVVSGIASLLVPTEALNKNAFTFDVLRFYYAHFTILAVPVLMLVFDIYRPDYKKCYYMPIGFIIVLCVILLNEILVISIGLDEKGFEYLLDTNYRNSSFIFGISDEFKGASKLVTWCTPDFFLKNPVTHQTQYWPILWLVLPSFLYFSLFSFLISMTYDFKRIKEDFSAFYAREIKREGTGINR